MPTPDDVPEQTVIERHEIVSDGLGMLQFPVDLIASEGTGDHVMGVAVMAWLTRFGIDRWGEAWVHGGSIDLRFRSHLTVGHRLFVDLAETSDGLDVTVAEPGGTTSATGTLALTAAPPLGVAAPTGGRRDRVAPVLDEVDGLMLGPLSFVFDANRDLAFTRGLDDADFWTDRRWAHPAWIASASNAVIRTHIDFPPPGGWTNAGLALTMHEPVTDATTLTIGGQVTETFDRGDHRFAVADLLVGAGTEPIVSIRNTFVYAPRFS